MRIGIDFDNTLVNYYGVFYNTAVSLGWIEPGIGESKNSVKSFFIERDQEPKWTELQGIVYGKTIAQAKPFDGAKSSLE